MNTKLATAYHNILNNFDDKYIIPNKSDDSVKDLSGLFLSSVHPDYEKSKNKIMIVGRETKGWKWNKKTNIDLTKKDICITQALKSHNDFFFEQLKKKNSKGNAFHNFTRDVGKKSGVEGLIYSNLFCFASNRTIPTKSPVFNDITKLSKQLLFAQIDILKPDIILFMNGFDKASVSARRQFFPIEGKNNVCLKREDGFDQKGITNKQLWCFDLQFKDRSITAYRTYHPSATSKKAKIGRDFLLNLLPEK